MQVQMYEFENQNIQSKEFSLLFENNTNLC
jgi:hypothetical protein